MGLVTCNGHAVLELRLSLPPSGIWTAALEVDSEETLEGAVELADDGITYSGTVVRSGVVVSTCRAEVVGGTNGLAKDLEARSYRGVAARAVLRDLLSAAGETLASTSTPAILASPLPFWTRAGVRAKDALTELTDALGAAWRVLPNGTVWVGTEGWAQAPDDYEAIELDRDDSAGSVLLAPETIGLYPGLVFEGRHVGRVEHHFTRRDPVRTTFWEAA